MPQQCDPFDTLLSHLSRDRSTEFGRPGARVDVLRRIEGPFSSVRQVRITAPSSAPTVAYIKILKSHGEGAEELARLDRMVAREHKTLLTVHRAAEHHAKLRTVRPIAYVPQLRAIVTEAVPGHSLSEVLKHGQRDRERLASAAAGVGAWIRLYQTLDDPARDVELAERRQYLDERLQLLERRVLSSADRRNVLALFDRLARNVGVPHVHGVRIHGDLAPTNIIVDPEGRVAVLDFTMVKAGTVYHDITHLYFHLELMRLRRRRRWPHLGAVQQALLEGYREGLTAEDPLFRLMLLQHAVCHVALLAERRSRRFAAAYHWLARRRWRLCEQMFGPDGVVLSGAATAGAASPPPRS